MTNGESLARAIILIGLAMLTACAPEQVQRAQETQARIEAAIAQGCAVVRAASAVAAPFAAVPQVAGVLVFADAGCGTAQAVAALTSKALNDPSTVEWVQWLAGQLNEAVALVRERPAPRG